MTLDELRGKYRQYGILPTSDQRGAVVSDMGWRVCIIPNLNLSDAQIEELMREGIATYRLEAAFKQREASEQIEANRRKARPW